MRLLIILFILSSCGDGSDTVNTVDTIIIPKTSVDTIRETYYDNLLESSSFTWQIDFEKQTKKINPNFKKENLNIDSIIKGLNKIFPNIKLERIKISHDTLYTKIEDSYYLNESMGTSGAEFYIAETVLNLTSVNNIKFVKIDFVEGSHASPDVWTKEDFENYKQTK